ncbi:MAG TPA: FAD-dependent oxidoreductase [Cyclobacteriaceae bacterium]
MEVTPGKVAVIGGGITGLSIAYHSRKNGNDVTLFEASHNVGGKIGSVYCEGLELDLGPITISENEKIRQLASELKLDIIEASDAVKKRYICSGGKLHPVGITSSLLSFGGKMSMLKAPFADAARENETVAAYASRRFGKEAYQRLFNPMMNGIYAGNSELICARTVFRKRGPRKIISFKGGVAALANGFANLLGDSIKTNSAVNDIRQLDGFDEIHVTTPAFVTANLIKELSVPLKSIHYSNVSQIYCEVIPGVTKFEGFGFLVPSEEKTSLLGAICVSNIFPSKGREGRSLFVLFSGGDRPYPLTPSVEDAVREFNKILQPAVTKVLHVHEYKNGIPQFYVGHDKIVDHVREFEKVNPRIKISGNYLSGVAVGDCL